MQYSFRNLFSSWGRSPGTDVRPPSIVNKVLQGTSARPHVVDDALRQTVTVLAEFHVETAAIRANDALLQAMSRNRKTRHNLCDEDVETIVHAFAHALHHKDIYEQFEKPQDRAEEMIRRRNRDVKNSSEESYTNRTLQLERRAEECVQMVRMEILSSFDRAGHGPGLSDESIADKAEEFAAESVRQSRKNHASRAKDEYRYLVSHGSVDSSQEEDVDVESAGLSFTRLPVQNITWLFPLDQSATLDKMVGQIVKYKVDIVVPDPRPGNNAQV